MMPVIDVIILVVFPRRMKVESGPMPGRPGGPHVDEEPPRHFAGIPNPLPGAKEDHHVRDHPARLVPAPRPEKSTGFGWPHTPFSSRDRNTPCPLFRPRPTRVSTMCGTIRIPTDSRKSSGRMPDLGSEEISASSLAARSTVTSSSDALAVERLRGTAQPGTPGATKRSWRSTPFAIVGVPLPRAALQLLPVPGS